jgi:hypothetical protein
MRHSLYEIDYVPPPFKASSFRVKCGVWYDGVYLVSEQRNSSYLSYTVTDLSSGKTGICGIL